MFRNDTESIDIGALDIDNLVGEMMDDEDLLLDVIPSKDSSDDNKMPTGDEALSAVLEMQSYDDSRSEVSEQQTQQKPLKDTLKKPQTSATTQDSMDISNYNINDIDPFGEEEKQLHAIGAQESDLHLPDMDRTKTDIQHLLDVSVMTLLHPDFYKEENLILRREQLKKHSLPLQDWKNAQIDSFIVSVADAMSKINNIAMYDQDWHANVHKDDEKTKETYLLQEEDLLALKMVPESFFGKQKNGPFDDKTQTGAQSLTSGTADYLRNNTEIALGETLKGGLKTLKGGFGAVAQIGGQIRHKSNVVCGACGVRLKFKPKRRHKYNYIGFICKKTGREWVFHDYLCVKLRKIKEAIKEFVYASEKDENINVEDENALINIETNASQKASSHLRPVKKTTPKKGDHNYNLDADTVISHRDDSVSSWSRPSISSKYDSDDSEHDQKQQTDILEKANHQKQSKSIRDINRDKVGYIIADGVEVPQYLDFRRYRTHTMTILDRLNAEKQYKGAGATYAERFSDLPQILLYCDLNEYGVAVFEFISHSLKSKMRKSLWHILEWLALEMPTNEILHLLKRHTHLLSKHELVNYDKICKATMEGSKFPIACTLRLSAFMYERADVDVSNREAFRRKGEQYVNVSRKLLKEIESDHLFALLLMIPTDIAHQNVIEIALKYDLTYFLEEPRIVRVFSVIWFNGFDFLDPNNSFSEPDISVDTIFDKLLYDPGRFFFSAFGKFVIESILYLGYLGLFSYVTYLRIYNYPINSDPLEIILWVGSAGYVVYEMSEFIDSPTDYFNSMANYFDVLITVSWLCLFYLRFMHPQELIYGDDGRVDENAQRNTLSTEIFMGLWAVQCVVLWTRVASLFKISERAGPLIRMIMNMLGDIVNFFLIWALFFIGGSFAAYYIIGNDLMNVVDVGLGTFSSVSFYIFKTLIGQQDWDKTASADIGNVEVFDTFRSNMLQSLLFFYSIFGTILLLNLLIAMMASSYEMVKDKSLQEVNKQKIDTIYELDRSRSIITPPFNVLAYLFYVYWFAFEIIAFALTFGHQQFNEEYFSPINHSLRQYSVGDIITFRESDRQLKGKCIKKTAKSLRNSKKSLGGASIFVHQISMDDDEDLSSSDLIVLTGNDIKYELNDSQIVAVKKTFFKGRKLRIPSLSIENKYCRYCRYNLTHDSMTIEYYLSLFELCGQHIDPDDKKYMQQLITTSDAYGIPTPLTCSLCANCYRPFKVLSSGQPDVLNRMMYIMEIVSYMVFYITLRWVILLVIFLPACIIKIIKFLIKKFTQTLSGKSSSRTTKSIMNTSEENDDYRAQVRQVSKSEEKLDAVVRRIDTSVNRLQQTLLGDNDGIGIDEDDIDEDIHNLRSDEFDQEIKKIKNDLNQKFMQIQKLLTSSGFQDY